MKILSSTEIMTTNDALTIALVGVFVFLFVVGIIMVHKATNKVLGIVGITICVVSIISGIAGCILRNIEYVPTGRMRVEAIINEDTTFNEVCNKYNVVGQRDEIFILEEK